MELPIGAERKLRELCFVQLDRAGQRDLMAPAVSGCSLSSYRIEPSGGCHESMRQFDYIPDTGGLNSGMQTPEGITYANYFFWYPSTKFKDQNGNTAGINFDRAHNGSVIHLWFGSSV